jgi:putative ABC transport system permease protein
VSVSLLSGLYPAFVLSGFNPINALKAKLESQSSKGFNVRKGLVVVQFVIAQMLIIGTLVVIKQMRFFENATLGFDKSSVVTVRIPTDSLAETKIDYLKQELKKNPMIQAVSFSFAAPSDNGNWYSDFKFDNSDKNTDFGANMKLADADYLATYSIPLVAGRNYKQSDTAGEIVVNEELVKRLGLRHPQDILNKKLNFWDGEAILTVVGVIRNFHTSSLEEPISPVLVGTNKSTYQLCNIKLKMQDTRATLAAVENLWNNTFPSFVFEYRFLDDTIAAFYRQERQLADLFKVFASIAVLLSCLGLYGLASLLAVQKIKEVGIRKVLGATVSQIVMLFSKEFVGLVILAFLIAAPVAYYFMHGWLQEFTYRTNLSWWVFALAGLLTVVIALATISVHAIRAALQDPVKNLRTE